ncbi:VOC family protein [Prauserella muralis]|uniref:Glyoxalase n=1 Tax=Prauserella muralis TaxID=588067 RepID=A0A2V4BC02_9PSEU|nr:VOC family protein [Prauserella muralis]PXY27159.1 glyoxalase [Prauserella muralis]TWE23194.1 hypothetical protein FHX69_4454 [Prauserella muralis]
MSVDTPGQSALLPAGTPCWIELATTDEAVACEFYGRLFGWEFSVKRDPATPTRRYTIATLGGYQVGGLYQAARDQPTGWTVHLAVANTTSTADWVEHLGGTRTLGPVDIPDRGSVLHAIDPSGAPVVFWAPPEDWAFTVGIPGSFSGVDLNTHDGESADAFYCRLFGFASEQIGEGGIDYTEWRIGPEPVMYRYAMNTQAESTIPPHWMIYFTADPARGTDAMAGQSIMLGGSVVTPPFDTPFGRTAMLADPGGSLFSVIDHSRPVDTGAGRAEVDDPYDD